MLKYHHAIELNKILKNTQYDNTTRLSQAKNYIQRPKVQSVLSYIIDVFWGKILEWFGIKSRGKKLLNFIDNNINSPDPDKPSEKKHFKK